MTCRWFGQYLYKRLATIPAMEVIPAMVVTRVMEAIPVMMMIPAMVVTRVMEAIAVVMMITAMVVSLGMGASRGVGAIWAREGRGAMVPKMVVLKSAWQ